jgi:D-alanyl-D-alanine carboxypeptidase
MAAAVSGVVLHHDQAAVEYDRAAGRLSSPDSFPEGKDLVADIHRTFTPAQLVGYAYPYTETTPWHYSNTNYILVGMIIAKATGMSYEDALNKMLLQPLQLHETYYRPQVPPKRVLDAMASGYANEPYCVEFGLLPPCAQQPVDDFLGHDLKTINLSAYGSTGGIVASLPDVTRWVRALFGDRLLPLRQRRELFSLVSKASGQPIATTSLADRAAFSLGVQQQFWLFLGGRPMWNYEGSTFGYRVVWFRRPPDDLVVAMAPNSAVDDAFDRTGDLETSGAQHSGAAERHRHECPAAGVAEGLAASLPRFGVAGSHPLGEFDPSRGRGPLG